VSVGGWVGEGIHNACVYLYFYTHKFQIKRAHYTCGVQLVLWGPNGGPHMLKEIFKGQNLVLWLGLQFYRVLDYSKGPRNAIYFL